MHWWSAQLSVIDVRMLSKTVRYHGGTSRTTVGLLGCTMLVFTVPAWYIPELPGMVAYVTISFPI